MSTELYSILVKPRPHLWWWVNEKNKYDTASFHPNNKSFSRFVTSDIPNGYAFSYNYKLVFEETFNDNQI